MADLNLEIILEEKEPLIELIKGLEALSLRVHDLKPIEKEILRVIFNANREQMLQQGQPSGDPYALLSQPYAAYKARKAPGKAIMFLSDDLFNAVTGSDAAGYKVTPVINSNATEALEVEFINDYLPLHQAGVGRLPKRPPVFVPDEAIFAALEDYLNTFDGF